MVLRHCPFYFDLLLTFSLYDLLKAFDNRETGLLEVGIKAHCKNLIMQFLPSLLRECCLWWFIYNGVSSPWFLTFLCRVCMVSPSQYGFCRYPPTVQNHALNSIGDSKLPRGALCNVLVISLDCASCAVGIIPLTGLHRLYSQITWIVASVMRGEYKYTWILQLSYFHQHRVL